MGFYLVPSSKTYFSATSFCLTFCVCGLLSTGWKTVALLSSGVCPLVGVIGPEACAGFLVGGTGACLLVGGAGSCPSGGQSCVTRCVYRWLWAQYGFRHPVCWWVGLCFYPAGCLAWGITALEPVGCWVGPGLDAKMATSGRAHTNQYFLWPLPPVSLPPTVRHSRPPLPRRPSKTHR